jgi:murein DD-endopeptidase MepM/ murein hydrolase activator NlpD
MWWISSRRSTTTGVPAHVVMTPDAGVTISAATETLKLAPAVPGPEDMLKKLGLRRVTLTINGPLERSFVSALGKDLGQPLTQVVTRALIWWVEVPGGLRRGDRLDVLFQERPNEEPLVQAVRFAPVKSEKIYAAYRFKAEGESFARLYQHSGEELELRLKEGPLADYEQITSFIRDGRRHKGVDFKTPVGSKVHAPFDGVVTRKTWAFRANGNSLEITSAERRVIFLHLSEIARGIGVGTRVTKGQLIAQSGNTGHSFAPHLHYQLMAGERVLDPFKIHETYRRSLVAEQVAAFEAASRKLDDLMTVPLAAK